MCRHVGSSFGLGATLATYLFMRSTLPLPEPTGFLAWQVAGMLAVGVVLFIGEAALFVRALARQGTAIPSTLSWRRGTD